MLWRRSGTVGLSLLLAACGDAGGGPQGGASDGATSGGDTSGGSDAGASAAPSTGSTGDDGGTAGAPTTSGSGGDSTTGEEGFGPGPWDHGVYIPPEPQKDGDPALGYEALLTKGYVSCGVPWGLWPLVKPLIGVWGERPPLPGRTGKNAEVPYHWNVHSKNGVDIVSQNCLQCHAGSFNGQLIVGLGTADFDFTDDISQLLTNVWIPDIPIPGLEEFTRFLNRTKALGPQTVMRTVGTNPAEMIAVSLVAHRDKDTLAWHDEQQYPIPEMYVASDPPPWWRAKKKHALFYNGMARGDHRGTMMLASALCTDTVEEAAQIDSYFHHVQAFIRSVQAPKYPFAIDAALAKEGEGVFLANCAGCHGTYAADEAQETYPNLLFPLDVIGTDPVVAEGGTKYAPYLVDWYNESFYGKITRMEPDDPFPGYMAPPLDGIWATGPFLHNGSVPTIELVLDSTRRPKYWKRVDFDSTNFDEDALGWPFVELPYGQIGAPDAERKFIYDTTLLAHSNTGHTFGDHLTTAQRRAVLEYLKTL
jgi:mono/diheme cytochrome c family protein